LKAFNELYDRQASMPTKTPTTGLGFESHMVLQTNVPVNGDVHHFNLADVQKTYATRTEHLNTIEKNLTSTLKKQDGMDGLDVGRPGDGEFPLTHQGATKATELFFEAMNITNTATQKEITSSLKVDVFEGEYTLISDGNFQTACDASFAPLENLLNSCANGADPHFGYRMKQITDHLNIGSDTEAKSKSPEPSQFIVGNFIMGCVIDAMNRFLDGKHLSYRTGVCDALPSLMTDALRIWNHKFAPGAQLGRAADVNSETTISRKVQDASQSMLNPVISKGITERVKDLVDHYSQHLNSEAPKKGTESDKERAIRCLETDIAAYIRASYPDSLSDEHTVNYAMAAYFSLKPRGKKSTMDRLTMEEVGDRLSRVDWVKLSSADEYTSEYIKLVLDPKHAKEQLECINALILFGCASMPGIALDDRETVEMACGIAPNTNTSFMKGDDVWKACQVVTNGTSALASQTEPEARSYLSTPIKDHLNEQRAATATIYRECVFDARASRAWLFALAHYKTPEGGRQDWIETKRSYADTYIGYRPNGAAGLCEPDCVGIPPWVYISNEISKIVQGITKVSGKGGPAWLKDPANRKAVMDRLHQSPQDNGALMSVENVIRAIFAVHRADSTLPPVGHSADVIMGVQLEVPEDKKIARGMSLAKLVQYIQLCLEHDVKAQLGDDPMPSDLVNETFKTYDALALGDSQQMRGRQTLADLILRFHSEQAGWWTIHPTSPNDNSKRVLPLDKQSTSWAHNCAVQNEEDDIDHSPPEKKPVGEDRVDQTIKVNSNVDFQPMDEEWPDDDDADKAGPSKPSGEGDTRQHRDPTMTVFVDTATGRPAKRRKTAAERQAEVDKMSEPSDVSDDEKMPAPDPVDFARAPSPAPNSNADQETPASPVSPVSVPTFVGDLAPREGADTPIPTEMPTSPILPAGGIERTPAWEVDETPKDDPVRQDTQLTEESHPYMVIGVAGESTDVSRIADFEEVCRTAARQQRMAASEEASEMDVEEAGPSNPGN